MLHFFTKMLGLPQKSLIKMVRYAKNTEAYLLVLTLIGKNVKVVQQQRILNNYSSSPNGSRNNCFSKIQLVGQKYRE